MSKKPRLIPEAHARRIFAVVRISDGRVLDVFCTREGARFYRSEQIKAGHWRRGGTRIERGAWAPDPRKDGPNV
jgi:hypothetical protein